MTDRRSTASRAKSNRRDSNSISSTVRSRSPPFLPTFTQQFIEIIRQHKSHCDHIQRLLAETQKSYEKINEDGALIAESLIKIQLEPIDEHYLHSLIQQPLALIICSPTFSGKVQFVNELLNVALLPEESPITNDEFIPMIRVQNYPDSEFRLNTSAVLDSNDSKSNYQKISWTTLPFHDLIFDRSRSVEQEMSFIEIRRPIELLEEDIQLLIMPSNSKTTQSGQLYAEIKKTLTPIFIYIINKNTLSDDDIEELQIFRETLKNEPILFVQIDQSHALTSHAELSCVQVFKQLCDAGFLSFITDDSTDTRLDDNQMVHSDIIDHGLTNQSLFLDYIRKHIDRLALRAVNILQTLHETCLEFFHASAFDLARDILITPTRLSYVRETEKNLYQSLIDLTDSKQKEIRKLILQALTEVRENLFDEVTSLEIPDVELTDQLTVKRVQDVQKCNNAIQEFVRHRVDEAIAIKLFDSINVLQDNYVGTLRRCLFSLEKNIDGDESELSATKALQEILRSAYQVNVAPPTNPGFFQIFVDRMRELFRTFSWSPNPRIDQEFKHSVALNILNNLSEIKLAKSICSQLNDRLQMSHENFGRLLNQLERRHLDRLKTTEDEQERVRKSYTPKFARLLLESTSLRDLIRYGLPKIGREVGRGHYGIVYEARDWANHRSCVVKSVVPHDDDNWQSLALEFHYCRRISEHPRIVKLIGSVIDYSDPDRVPVLLMMERLRRDLHAALKHHLEFSVRMRIALDVVEGLRYLHGLGLVHRDIKLNNVLLDEHDRAQLTDLGFCKPEVMMSGSVVGTPIHMAPELFSSKYDHNVDVYAFGILFWYICSNNVKLPTNFETCSSKDVLWVAVKKGIRPERLNTFTDQCWDIMRECWNERSSARPYLGEVQKKIELILNPTPSPCENDVSMFVIDTQTNEK